MNTGEVLNCIEFWKSLGKSKSINIFHCLVMGMQNRIFSSGKVPRIEDRV